MGGSELGFWRSELHIIWLSCQIRIWKHWPQVSGLAYIMGRLRQILLSPTLFHIIPLLLWWVWASVLASVKWDNICAYRLWSTTARVLRYMSCDSGWLMLTGHFRGYHQSSWAWLHLCFWICLTIHLLDPSVKWVCHMVALGTKGKTSPMSDWLVSHFCNTLCVRFHNR